MKTADYTAAQAKGMSEDALSEQVRLLCRSGRIEKELTELAKGLRPELPPLGGGPHAQVASAQVRPGHPDPRGMERPIASAAGPAALAIKPPRRENAS